MEQLKAYKVELDPNNKQITQFRKNCGAARYAFNFALQKKKEAFESEEKIKTPNSIELSRELNKLKGTDELPWAYDVSKCSFQEGLRDCDKAFQNFFRRCKQGKGPKGFPRWKSKRNDKQSFRLAGTIKVLGDRIQLPRLGKIKLKEVGYLPEKSRILSATVSSKAGKWFVSILVKEDIELLDLSDKVVGVDLGIKDMATCSDGQIFQNPKALKSNLKRIKRLQRRYSKKKKGSNNKQKLKVKLQKAHYKAKGLLA